MCQYDASAAGAPSAPPPWLPRSLPDGPYLSSLRDLHASGIALAGAALATLPAMPALTRLVWRCARRPLWCGGHVRDAAGGGLRLSSIGQGHAMRLLPPELDASPPPPPPPRRSGNPKVTLPEARALLERAPALRELGITPDASRITAPAKKLLRGGGVAVEWPAEPPVAAEEEDEDEEE